MLCWLGSMAMAAAVIVPLGILFFISGLVVNLLQVAFLKLFDSVAVLMRLLRERESVCVCVRTSLRDAKHPYSLRMFCLGR